MDEKQHDSIEDQLSRPLDNPVSIIWTAQDEQLLKQWGNNAECFKLLHNIAYEKYTRMHVWFNLPIIAITTFGGTSSFCLSKVTDPYLKDIMSMIIGAFSIFAGFLATVYSFFKFAEKMNDHQKYSKDYDKLNRNIQAELAKQRSERMSKSRTIDIFKKEYDSLCDTSPTIDKDVRDTFLADVKIPDNFTLPYIFNELGSIKINTDNNEIIN